MTHFQLFATAYSIHLELPSMYVVRYSAAGTATCLGLGSPGMESRWGRDFQHPYKQTLRVTHPPAQWVPRFFTGSRAARTWLWPHTPV